MAVAVATIAGIVAAGVGEGGAAVATAVGVTVGVVVGDADGTTMRDVGVADAVTAVALDAEVEVPDVPDPLEVEALETDRPVTVEVGVAAAGATV